MADLQVRELVAAEAERIAGLPIAEQVAAMERFLDRHGLLGRAGAADPAPDQGAS